MERFYHGSNKGELTTLVPMPRGEAAPILYLTTNIVVATIYTVKIVESYFDDNGLTKPNPCYQFYPYGFDRETGLPIIEEFYHGMFESSYMGKEGYIYTTSAPQTFKTHESIKSALSTTESLDVLDCMYIPDVYERLRVLAYEGQLIMYHYNEVPAARKARTEQIMRHEIESQLTKDNKDGALDFLRAKMGHLF